MAQRFIPVIGTYETDSDPTIGAGVTAPYGQWLYRSDTGGNYYHNGSGPNDWILIAAGGALPTNPLLSLPEQWGQGPNIAISQAAIALPCLVSQSFDTVQAIRAGSIVGIRSRLLVPCSAGTLSVRVNIAGVPGTLAVDTSSVLNSSGGQATQAEGIDLYTAGQAIGVNITTNGVWAPVANNLQVWLEVQPS